MFSRSIISAKFLQKIAIFQINTLIISKARKETKYIYII